MSNVFCFVTLNVFFSFLFFLSEDGKKSLPIIPGVSATPGTMIYAGSIGTQIANELLDFNRCGLTNTGRVLFAFSNNPVIE